MGHIAKAYLAFILAFIGLLTLGPVNAHSELRAALSANQIEELDSVQLVIRDLGGRETLSPDLSVLDQDFVVLGVNTSSQYQFINGRAQSWVDYSISLQPKKTGVLTVAPISIGNKRSAPLQLTVRPLSRAARQEIDNLVFYELVLSKDSVYVQSQLLLTRRLIYAKGVQLFGGQLDTPKIDNAQIFALGEGTAMEVQRNGRTMGSFEQRYAVFPESSGTLLIPNESVNASVQLRRGGSSTRKTVKVSSGERLVQVKGIPLQYPSEAPWLPAIAVTASQRYTPSVDQQVKVGDTIKRTLTITAFGNTGASITPQETDLDPAKFKTYDQPTSIDNALTDENLVGQRVESVDLVPVAGGTHALPGATITWWNTDTDEVMTTVVQSAVLSVTGPAISSANIPEQQAIDQPGKPQLGGTVETNANRLDWWILALALLALLAAKAIRGRRRHATRADHAAGLSMPSQDPVESAPRVSLKQVLKALDDDQPTLVRRQLAMFLTQHYRQPQQRAFELFQASGPSAGNFARGLSAACFGESELSQAHRQQGRKALMSLNDKANKPTRRSKPSLPALYPD
jgi:hypothetical protein